MNRSETKKRRLLRSVVFILKGVIVTKKLLPILSFAVSFVLFVMPVMAGAAALVEDFPTVQAYTDEPVDENDIIKILNAGINAPSSMNSQPWHFTVVTDKEVMAAIASEGDMSSSTRAGITQAPLAIVVSCKKGAEFDAGLTTQAMSIEAQLLGYGSKLFTSVKTTMNGAREQEFREMLQIPDDFYAFVVLIVGRQDLTVDATSTATGRYPLEQMATFITP